MTFEEWFDEQKKDNGRLRYTRGEFLDFGYDIAKLAWEAGWNAAQELLNDEEKRRLFEQL